MRRYRWHRSQCLLAIIGAVGLNACAGVTEPPGPAEITLVLSVSSITLLQGARDQAVVTIGSKSSSVKLTVTGLPPGVVATFQPESLARGEKQSVLTVSADSGATVGEVTLTVQAEVVQGIGGGAVTQATASLRVRVTDCPGYAIPSSCPPFPTGGGNFISGVVVERTQDGNRPVGGASVWAWVQRADNGYSAGRVLTDANGAYHFPNLPNALVVMQTAGGGYDQPCASIVSLTGPTAVANLEIVSDKSPIVSADPPPPALVGVVYEMTASGRQPVAGARVFFETLFEVVAATTTTDELGRYSLCRLPSINSFVTPVKSGYVISGTAVTVSGVMQMDIEMKKQ